MINSIIVIPDQHAIPSFNNDRADWLGQLIKDEKPDVVWNLGDCADMESLSSYDKGKRSFQGKNYKEDINAHLEFQERMWSPIIKTKKKRPFAIVHEGNHEARIERALDLSPELEGTIGFKDYQFDQYYDVIVRYDGGTPGVYELEGILAAHYFITGISGRPLGGEHPAFSHMVKVGQSTLSGHSHILDFNSRRNISGKQINNLVAGCYHEYTPEWAGNIGQLWTRGVAILHNVENGQYDFQWISLENLKARYG